MSRAITSVLLLLLSSSLMGCWGERTRHSDRISDSARIDDIEVTASVEGAGSERHLRFKIKNFGAEPLTVPHRFLPWGGNAVNWGSNPVLLLTAKTNTGRMVRPTFPISEVAPDNQVTLDPNDAAEGLIPLIPYFADLREGPEGPVTLYWSYRLPHHGGTEHVFSGSVVLR